MLTTNAPAPLSLIKPLLLFRFRASSTSPRTISIFPTTKLHSSHPRQNTVCAFIAMAGNNAAAGVSSPEHVAGKWYSVPALRLRDHRFTVPLDYALDRDASPKISLFARELVAVGKEEQSLPYLLFLQGGPGFECPGPTESSGWINRACEEFRVVLMDQRGTGLSTPLSVSSMLQMKSAKDLVDYLKHFRADSIVNDAEFIRVRLDPDAKPWTVLGQSYGGFCAVTYLSFAPQGLKQVLLTGGTPPLGNGCPADSVYKVAFEQVIHQNEKYYKRFPQDVEIVCEIVKHLAESEGGGVLLPSGGILTPRVLQLVGLSALGSSTGFERLHYMLETAWDPVIVPGAPKVLSYCFLKAVENFLSFDTNPLYALMQETIYCQGASSQWSAHRIRAEYEGKFDAIKTAKEGHPVLFTGELHAVSSGSTAWTNLCCEAVVSGVEPTEMIFPWMFDEIHALKPFKEAANLLAEKKDWTPLYNIETLKNNKVPVAAAVYYEDMYVNFKVAMETASQIAGIRLWITNEYLHSGLRDAGGKVLDHLLAMLNGKKPLF